MTEQENILRWWETIPYTLVKGKPRKIISMNLMEEIADVPRGTFQYFLTGVRDLPPHHLPVLITLLKTVGYPISGTL